jgi:hypothetical protein
LPPSLPGLVVWPIVPTLMVTSPWASSVLILNRPVPTLSREILSWPRIWLWPSTERSKYHTKFSKLRNRSHF